MTTVPEEDIGYSEYMRKNDPSVVEFHPSSLYICRRKGREREYHKEPVPNWRMFQQEFNILDRKVFIRNKTSEQDEERNIPDEDFLFELGEDNTIHLGDESTNLNMLILKNVTDQRSRDEQDITLGKMIQSRVPNSDIHSELKKYFSGRKSVNKTRMRLRVDIFCPHSGRLLAQTYSGSVVNTDNKSSGALDFYDVIRNQSCGEGREKIVMISQFALDKTVRPRFQLWKVDGERVEQGEEESLLAQPSEENVKIVRDNIVFQAPRQAHLEQITSRGYTFKLVGVRGSDDYESRAHDFHYIEHNLVTYKEFLAVSKDQNTFKIVEKCVFCEFDPGNSKRKSLVPKLESAKPHKKRKTLDKDKVTKVRRVSSASSQSSVLSPDSGIDTMEVSGSPPELSCLFDNKTMGEMRDIHSGQDTILVDFDFDLERQKIVEEIVTDNTKNKPKSSNENAGREEDHKTSSPLIPGVLLLIAVLVLFLGLTIPEILGTEIWGLVICFVILVCIMFYHNNSNTD